MLQLHAKVLQRHVCISHSCVLTTSLVNNFFEERTIIKWFACKTCSMYVYDVWLYFFGSQHFPMIYSCNHTSWHWHYCSEHHPLKLVALNYMTYYDYWWPISITFARKFTNSAAYCFNQLMICMHAFYLPGCHAFPGLVNAEWQDRWCLQQRESGQQNVGAQVLGSNWVFNHDSLATLLNRGQLPWDFTSHVPKIKYYTT